MIGDSLVVIGDSLVAVEGFSRHTLGHFKETTAGNPFIWSLAGFLVVIEGSLVVIEVSLVVIEGSWL